MDLFATLNVATLKNILHIPIVCNIFVVSMEMREKNQSHVTIQMLEIIKKIIANLITIVQNYYATG
jgi:hypothetical protein